MSVCVKFSIRQEWHVNRMHEHDEHFRITSKRKPIQVTDIHLMEHLRNCAVFARRRKKACRMITAQSECNAWKKS